MEERMKKLLKQALAACAAVLLSAGISQAADYNLKLQTYYPATTLQIAKGFADNVKAMSNGRVDIQIFSGGELVGSGNILKSVKTGMIDIGHGMGHHFAEMKTGTLESGLPMAWMDATEAQILYKHRGLKEIFEKQYENAGVVYLGPTRASAYQLLTKTPVSSLDELRKLKIRAVGAAAKMLTNLGVSCVNLPVEDIYMALSTGQIDGVLYGNAFEYEETKYYEVARYINTTPLIDPITDTLIINKKLWDSFPDDIKAIFRAAADCAVNDYYFFTANESMRVIGTTFKDKTTSFSAEDQKETLQAAIKVWDEEAKRSPEFAKGVEILKQFAKEKGRL